MSFYIIRLNTQALVRRTVLEFKKSSLCGLGEDRYTEYYHSEQSTLNSLKV